MNHREIDHDMLAIRACLPERSAGYPVRTSPRQTLYGLKDIEENK